MPCRAAVIRALVLSVSVFSLWACSDSGPGKAEGLDVAVLEMVAPGSAEIGSTFEVKATVANVGSMPASPAVAFVLSAGDTADMNDMLLALTVPQLMFQPGETLQVTESVSLLASVASGGYTIGAIAPPHEDDVNPDNNAVMQPIQIAGVDCEPDAFEPDDTPEQARPLQLSVAQQHDFCEDTTDWVSFSAVEGQTLTVLLDDLERHSHPTPTIYESDGQTALASKTNPLSEEPLVWTAPSSGDYLLRLEAAFGLHGTGEETGYVLSLSGAQVDIDVNELVGQVQSNPGGLVGIYVSFELLGDAGLLSGVELGLYLSSDAIITTADQALATLSLDPQQLADGHVTLQGTIPASTAVGDYFIGVIADPQNEIAEQREDNNTASTPATIEALACTPDAYEEDDTASAAKPLPFNAEQEHDLCDDEFDWFSLDLSSGGPVALRVEKSHSLPLELDLFSSVGVSIGEQKTGSFSWTASSGSTLLLRVAAESGTSFTPVGSEDSYAIALLQAVPDLRVGKLDPWAGLISGGQSPVDVQIVNEGGADASSFRAGLYLSADASVTTTDTLLAEVFPVSVGWSGPTRTIGYQLTAAVPASISPGAYTLGLIVDVDGGVTESDESNNTLSVAVVVN